MYYICDVSLTDSKLTFMKNNNLVILLIIISVTLIFRMLPHLPNFVPFGAAALLLGSRFSNKIIGLALLIGSLLASDLWIQINFMAGKTVETGFHSTMPFVYLSFVLYFILGKWATGKQMVLKSLGLAAAGSLAFFVITNFGVWAVGSLYPKSFEGLMACFTMAIPFYKTTFLSDLMYTFTFFCVYRLYTIVALNRATVKA